jgi:hypothetical protein
LFLNRWSAVNFYHPEKSLLTKVFSSLKLLGKGYSEDKKAVSEKQQQSHQLFSISTIFVII